MDGNRWSSVLASNALVIWAMASRLPAFASNGLALGGCCTATARLHCASKVAPGGERLLVGELGSAGGHIMVAGWPIAPYTWNFVWE